MQRSLMLVLAVVAAGCSNDGTATESPTAVGTSLTSSAATVPAGTYVLRRLGAATAAPFATFDHVCGPSQIHRQILIAGDTILLSANGTAQRSIAMRWVDDGITRDSATVVSTGSWNAFDATGLDFFSGFPAIIVNAEIPASTGGVASAEIRLRVESNGDVSTPTATGGSCEGSPNDGQHVVATYRRI